MNICAVQSFKPLLKFPGALCCTIETSIIHSTILNDSDVFKLMFSRTRDVRHVGILFSFWYKLDQVWTWSSFPLPPYLIPLTLVIFFIAICLFAGGYQVAVSKFFIIRMVKSSYPKTSSEFFINKIVKLSEQTLIEIGR